MSSDRILGAMRLIDGWFSVDRMTVELAGERLERDLVRHPSGATILPYDPERRVATVVSETRLAILHAGVEPLWEAVAGVLDEDEPEACARREALEEAGLRLRTLEPVGRVWMTPSTSTEQVHLFLAPYLPEDRVAEGGGLAEEAEHLRVREVPLAELAQAAEAGTLADAKTLLLVQALRLRHPDLFGDDKRPA